MKPLTRAVARLLLKHEGQLISMQDLARVGGAGGWRTRVSEARIALEPLGYRLENEQGEIRTEMGRRRTSGYRLVKA